ncbi:MAG: spore coat associated protein CotJA [Peptococcaceae bacterium]|nr:spore coat associated protein CotJA [Peptococcaceae bacterium]
MAYKYPEECKEKRDYPGVLPPRIQLAEAYVPIQLYDERFCPEVALMKGTLFPSLYRPYCPEEMYSKTRR